MRKITARAVIALAGLILATEDRAAEVVSTVPDYKTDRGFSGMSFSVFSRVYPGRMPTQNCIGETLHECAARGRLDNLDCQPRADGILICNGKRNLFRGTDTDSKPTGPERRELRLRDGKIEAEWVVIQIVEELTFGAQPETATRRCESFGTPGLSPCVDVAPIGPLPPPARAAPTFGRRYTPDELSGIAMTVHIMQWCMQGSPDLRNSIEPIYAHWREPRADVVGFMEAKLASEIADAVEKIPGGKIGSPEYAQCGQMLTSLDRQGRPPNREFRTPESTWATFKAALASGDAKAAASCFANPFDQFGTLISQLSSDDLKQLGATFKEFDMIDKPDVKQYQRGLVTRSDGMAGEVVFVQMGLEWRIEQM